MMGPEESALWAEVERTKEEHKKAVEKWHVVHTKAKQQEEDERIEKLVQERMAQHGA